jgi:RNA-directed DNA polymerase
LTPRNHGMNLKRMIKRLNPLLRGWANYFRVANCKMLFGELMEWIRRRLRMKQMKEWKSWKQLHKALRRRGYRGDFLKISMTRWRNSASPLIHMALPNSWFDEMGLINLASYKVGILHHFYE